MYGSVGGRLFSDQGFCSMKLHDRSRMEKECECYEEEVQPCRKTDYKPIIYILEEENYYFT